MNISLHPICGFHIGFELTDGSIEEVDISYLLIDLGILRIQCAWFKK
jgi:hypothetical protein